MKKYFRYLNVYFWFLYLTVILYALVRTALDNPEIFYNVNSKLATFFVLYGMFSTILCFGVFFGCLKLYDFLFNRFVKRKGAF